MKNHKRRALAAIPLLAAVMLLCFSSATSAQVAVVTIRSVYGDGIGEPLARPGGKVWISAEVTVSGKPCRIYMGVKIGDTVRDLEHVGAIQWNGPDTTTVTWSYTLEPNEADGLKDVTVTVRARDMVNDTWYGPAMSVIRQNGFTVDGTGPAFGAWDPAGPIVDQTSCVFTVPISDGAGVDWTKLTNESVVVIGGALDSVERQGDNARVSVVSMNQAARKSIVLTTWDLLGNSSTGRQNFIVADTVPPLMGEWVVDGVVVDDGVRILQNSPSFMMGITDDYPTSGIDSSDGVVFSLYDGEKFYWTDARVISYGDQYVTPLFWLRDGDYSLTFKATDRSGNQSSSALNFTIDTVQPQFSNPDPTHGFETNNRYITPTIHIADPAGRLRPDATVWRMKDPDSLDVSGQATWSDPVSRFTPGSAAAPAPLIKDGIYSLEVCAQDEVGHKPVYPPSGAWQFLLDTTAPVVDSIEPNVYRRIGGRIYTDRNGTDGKELELTVIVSDPGANPSGFNARGTLDVEVYDSTDTLISGQVTLDPSPRPDRNTDPWTATWKSAAVLPDGAYYVKVLATDDAGNTLTSKSFEFIVDTTPPDVDGNRAEVGFLNNTNDRRFTNNRQVQVEWDRASDPSAGSAPGSGLLGYSFETWTKEDGWSHGDGNGVKLYEGWTDTDSDALLGPPLNYLRPTGSSTEIWHSESLGLESGKSYGAWIRAWDMLHNGSDWFDPPFIFEADAPTDPGTPEVQNLGIDRRTRNNMPKLKWAHSTDEQEWAQSGVDLYEVEMARAVAAPQPIIWDICYKIDIPDEDVDKHLPDAPFAGDFEWTVSTPLADDEYVVRVRAKDVAGNYSNWIQITAPFAIDTSPPEVPGIPEPEATPTNIRKPQWTWAASAGAASYNVYLDGNAPISVTIAEFGASDYLADLDEGVHYLRVTALDDLGNESIRSGTGHATIDLTGPTAPGAPIAQVNPTNQPTQLWQWDYVEEGATFGVQTSENGSAWNTEVIVDNALTYTTDFTGNGVTRHLRVRAYDALGNVGYPGNEQGWSGAGSVFVDTVAPSAPTGLQLTEPDGVDIGGRLYTADKTPKVKWNAVGDEDLDHYVVEIDGQPWINVGKATAYHEFTEGLADGEHTAKVKAVDELGSESEYSEPLVFTMDTTPPAVPGMSKTTSPTNNRNPLWTWGVVLGAAKYRVFEDDVDKGFVTEPKYTSANLAEGTHYLQVTALGELGNESAKSEAGYVVIDLTVPAVPEMIPLAAYTNADEAMFVWTAISDAVTYDLEYTVGTATAVETGITVQKFTLDISAAVDGAVVSGKVRAYDAAGNAGGWSNTAQTVVDRTPPTVNAVTTPESPTNNPRPTWEWLGVDGVSGVDYYIVTLGGESPLEIEGESFIPESNLADGEHVLKVKAVDKAGNVGDYLTFAAVVIDTEAPERPNAPQTTSPTNNQSPVWTWGAVLGAAKYRVFEDDVDKGFVTEPTYTSANLAEGTHYLQVTALDALGNESAKSEAGYVVIDLTPPEVPVMKAMSLFTNETVLTFEWSASVDAATYELNYSKNGGVTWDDVPNFTAQSYTVDIADVSDGVAVLGKVRAYDGVGNVSDWSDAVQTIIDRTGPIVTIVSPTEPTITNKSAFTWKWSAVDAGSGVAGYWVSLDGGAALWTTESSVKLTGLSPGTHALTVKAVDRLGNIGIEAQSPVVTVVKAYVYDVKPFEGAYKINEISTISFKVGGLYDGQVKVFVGATELEAWRIVAISRMPAESKFYVLLDEEVMNPGMMTVGIDVGDGLEAFIYEVLTERSGYGFGRLRPW